MFHAMVRFILILFSQLRMLARGLIISRRFVQVRIASKHRSTHISNYQSSERESNKHDESDQMKFPCVLENALLIIRVRSSLSFATKRIGPPCCTFVTIVTCYSLQITLLSNYLLPIISVPADNTLLKTACHFLLLLVGFDTLTYRKDYDRSPILVGHQDSFLAPLPGSEAPLVSGIW